MTLRAAGALSFSASDTGAVDVFWHHPLDPELDPLNHRFGLLLPAAGRCHVARVASKIWINGDRRGGG